MTDVAVALAAVRARIERAGADPDAITIVGAKPPDVAACRAAIAAGVVDLGENRAQALAAKAPEVDGARWHFIGRLQTNKVRSIAALVGLWESLDRPDAIDAVAARASGVDVLVQVNISGETQKGGCEPSSTGALVRRAGEAGLRVIGLMGIGPAGDPEASRPGFRTLRGLADDLGLAVRSMGMTSDLEVAVQEGATMVRIGTALFGPRR
ncbi:MAG: dependent protein [Actinomycetota bacterium]|nr:dependent protein [Actinomycetota bacterium]